MPLRRPLCDVAPLIAARSYKRFKSVVSAFVLNRLLFCVLNRKVRCKTLKSLCMYRFSTCLAFLLTNTRLLSFPFVCSAVKKITSFISPSAFTTSQTFKLATSPTLNKHKCVSNSIALFRSAYLSKASM